MKRATNDVGIGTSHATSGAELDINDQEVSYGAEGIKTLPQWTQQVF